MVMHCLRSVMWSSLVLGCLVTVFGRPLRRWSVLTQGRRHWAVPPRPMVWCRLIMLGWLMPRWLVLMLERRR